MVLRLRTRVHTIPRRVLRKSMSRYMSTKTKLHDVSKKAQGLHEKKSRWRWFLPTAVILPLLYLTASQETNDTEPARSWHVRAYSTLPLKALSRVWGKFNDIDLPVCLREPGFKLYAWVFGANLDEMAEKNLRKYRNLSEFFYRELEPGARPISDALLVSPSDGKVLQFGQLMGDQIEQVKGVTYSLDAFIGIPKEAPHLYSSRAAEFDPKQDNLSRDEEFAELNGLTYTVDDIVGKSDASVEQQGDAAATNPPLSLQDMWMPDLSLDKTDKRLFYAVIYLAPGDYHRFHSPASWVVQLRRHYVGDLFSVAPYFQKKLADLFCLNERVALLGKWKYGFFSMIPVGATNVGSITINFDKYLKTNTYYVSDITQEKVRSNKKNCYEATYTTASPLLQGVPLTKGEEMGGFHLGSTVVLIFEAPKSFRFTVTKGETVKVGQTLGTLSDSES